MADKAQSALIDTDEFMDKILQQSCAKIINHCRSHYLYKLT